MMPMMMDDELDDLFGDQHLPSLTPVPRGLDQRIDHLRSSSCSQYVRLMPYLVTSNLRDS